MPALPTSFHTSQFIPNAMLDALLRAKLHHRDRTICLGLLRLTVGNGDELARISIRELRDLCGVEERSLRAALARLQRSGLVVRVDCGAGVCAAWAVEQDLERWRPLERRPGEFEACHE